MTAYPVLPAETLQQLPPHAGKVQMRLEKALKGLKRKIVVLDDDPTGVQTVHDVYVYTRWDRETIRDAFRAPERMFFVLTNSRGLTAPESRAQHREIAEKLAAVAAETGTDFVLLSRGDSTLRGHWPLETEVLRETLERESPKHFDGEVIYPFFPEGGRYTLSGVHYVRQGEQRVEENLAGGRDFRPREDQVERRPVGGEMVVEQHLLRPALPQGDFRAARPVERVEIHAEEQVAGGDASAGGLRRFFVDHDPVPGQDERERIGQRVGQQEHRVLAAPFPQVTQQGGAAARRIPVGMRVHGDRNAFGRLDEAVQCPDAVFSHFSLN